MSYCGLDHVRKYQQYHKRAPSASAIKEMDRTCEWWRDALVKGSPHVVVSKFWHAHLESFGAKEYQSVITSA